MSARVHNLLTMGLWAAGVFCALFGEAVIVAGLWAYPAMRAAIYSSLDLYTGCIRWEP